MNKKLIITAISFLLAAISFSSCKKSKDSPAHTPVINAINWKEELKNTIWAGEYKYTTGSNQFLQPFSTTLNADGTLTWTDLENTRPGGTWKVEGSQLNFTFPNKTTLSATLGKEQWSDFKSGVGAGFVIDNAFRSAQPDAASLVNTTWKGTDGVGNFTIRFINENSVELLGAIINYRGAYIISDGGLQFTSGSQLRFFGVFKKNKTESIGAYHAVSPPLNINKYAHWISTKQ